MGNSDWQRYLATQMASYGVDPRLLQQPPAQAIPPGSMPGMPGNAPVVMPPPRYLTGPGMQPVLAKKAQAIPPQGAMPGMPGNAPAMPPPQYQDPSDVNSQAIDEVRHTYEYVEARNAGMSDQDAILLVMRNATTGNGTMAPGFLDNKGAGEIASEAIHAPVDALQYAADYAKPALGLPSTDISSGNVFTDADGPAPQPMAPSAELTPQEEAGMNSTAIEADNWERILKPQYQAVYPEVDLNNEITRVQAELDGMDNTYASSLVGEGGAQGIAGATDIDGAQSNLDDARAEKELELQQLQAIRLALYGTPLEEVEEKDQPWYRDAIDFGKQVLGTVMGAPGVGKVLSAYDKPSQFMRQNMGGWVIRMAANGQLQPGMVLAMGPLGIATQEMGQKLSPAEINAAYAQGGNAAVWEYAVGRYPELMGMNDAERALFLGGLDAGFDPLNAVGTLAVATKGVPVIGKLIEGVDVAQNLPGHAVIGAAGKTAEGIKAIPVVGKLFEPGQTAITREIGNTAEDVAPALEAGKTLEENPTKIVSSTIGGVPIEPARMGPFTEIQPAPISKIPGPFGEASLEPLVKPAGTVGAASDVYPARPFYGDETPFSDADYAEYVQRTRAGEDPDVVLESIYVRGDGGTPAEITPEGESVAAPTPTRSDPLADLTGLDAPIAPRPEAPSRIAPEVPRPRYGDGTPFSEDDFQRYLANYGDEAQNDELIRTISQERLDAQQAIDAPTPKPPTSAPSPERPIPVASDVVEPPTTNPVEAPRSVSEVSPPTRPDVARYGDDPEVRDIPVELRGSNSPKLRDYGMPGWYQTGRGAWKQWDGISRIKGVRFNMPGEKAWRQRVRTIERDIESGVPINTDRLPSGSGLPDQETGTLINRYIVAPNEEATKILNILSKSGKNSYIDDAGNRFVRKAAGTWQDAGGGRQALNVISTDGKVSAQIIKNADNSYVIAREGVEAPARIRSLGGLGNPDELPYVKELTDRLKTARATYQANLGSVDAPTPLRAAGEAPYTPSTRTSRDIVEWGDGSLGISGFSKRQRDALNGLGAWSEKIRGVAPERIPDAKYVDPAMLSEDRLADRLARVGGIGQDQLDWLNTPIVVDDIRLQNMTTNQRKMAIQTLGLEPSAGGVKEVRELLTNSSRAPGFQAPTRGEVYEHLLETMADESAEARLELWKKILGGVKPALPSISQARRDNGLLAAGVAGTRKAWAESGAMVRSSILYNWPKAIYNTLQDAMTNHFVYIMDGQSGVSDLHAQMMKDYFSESKAGQNVRKLTGGMISHDSDEVRRFQSATREVESMYDSLGIPVPASVTSAFGGRFDEDLGRFIENGHTWWSDLGGRSGSKALEKAGGLISSPTVKMVRAANDDLMRRAGSADFIIRNYNDQYEEFLKEIRASAAKHGYDAEEAITRLQRYGNPVFGMPMFSPENVNDVFRAYNPGQAENLARKWRGRVNALNKGGADNVSRMSFSFMPTRLDEAVGKVWMFHYWMTRASIQHARLALENPNLMANYVRTWAGMEKMKDNEDLPAWARQYVSLMVGPYGMLGLVSPAAILTGLSVVMDANGVLDDPSAANLLSVLPFHPIVQAAASVYLNERLPDPTGTNNTRQFARAAINYMRNDMGVGEAGITGDPLANLTYKLQGLAREIAPGASPLAAPSPGQKDTQLVKYYAADIMRNTPDPENGGTLWQNPDGSITDYASQVMANIDAGLYSGSTEKEALQQFSTDTMAGRLAMTSLPVQSLYPSVVGGARTENAAAYQAENQPLQLDTGTAPVGSIGMEAFIDPSRPATTQEKGGDLAVGIGDAGSPVSASLVASLDQYSNLGDDETQDTYKNVNNYIYMTGAQLQQEYGGQGVVINGERFAWDVWNALPEDARRTYMDAWMKTSGYYDDVTKYRSDRDAFEAAHPEVEEFKRWQQTVGDEGGEAMLDRLNTDQFPAFQAWWATQDVKPADIQRILMTPSAYLASIGQEPSLWDINDISTKPTVDSGKASPLDVIAPKDTSNTGVGGDKPWDALTPTEKVARLNEKLSVYSAEMNMFDQAIAPYTGGSSYSQLGPSGIAILQAIMDKKGIEMPSTPSIVNDYFDWAYQQPSGSDTSPTAYVASLAGEETTDEVAA